MDKDEASRLGTALETALKENFAHARHAELQRERCLSFYWLLWTAALAYVARDPNFWKNVAQNRPLFIVLLFMSFAMLLANTKWSAEFANHMAAAAAIAAKLGLNRSTAAQARTPNWPLPYPEFTGYMALPLKFPIHLSVAAWVAGMHILGCAAAVWFAAFDLWDDTFVPAVSAAIAGAGAVYICREMYSKMKKTVPARTPCGLGDEGDEPKAKKSTTS